MLLIGNQGVGKNKLTDRLLGLLQCERVPGQHLALTLNALNQDGLHCSNDVVNLVLLSLFSIEEYVQLHRDTTFQSLTLAPSFKSGVVVWEDSPLLRAVKYGRCLVVDEADKAPLEVVCVLKALSEDGELGLSDGRSIVRHDSPAKQDVVRMSPHFRLIVLANRPGYPFMGDSSLLEGTRTCCFINPERHSDYTCTVECFAAFKLEKPRSRFFQALWRCVQLPRD